MRCEAYRQVCSFLAMGIVSLINQLNPGKIVMGGRLAGNPSGLLLDTIYKEVESRTHSLLVGKITLEVNQLHPSPSLLGAGAYAAYQELSHPEHLLTAFADRTALYAPVRANWLKKKPAGMGKFPSRPGSLASSEKQKRKALRTISF